MAKAGFLRFKKLRFYFAWPSAVLLAFYARTNNSGFLTGIPVIALGETLRIWSQGCIQKRTRLATAGPYAYTRNPLYLSNFLIGLGFVLTFSNIFLTALYLFGFFVLYRGTIMEEEMFLSKEYGNLYKDYLSKVPRFFPNFTSYQNRSDQTFDMDQVFRHGEHITFLTILLILASLYLRQAWYQAGGGFYSSHHELFWFSIFLTTILLVAMFHRKFK